MDKIRKARVALIKGQDRYENIIKALSLLPKIRKEVEGKKKVLIKPNCVSDSIQLASTHVNALREIVVAEGSAYSTEKAFKNFNYYMLKEYDVEFVDLNKDEFEEFEVYDARMQAMKVGVAKTVLQLNCYISVTPPKTHDTVILTLAIKNIVVGSLIKNYVVPRIRARPVGKLISKTLRNIFRDDKSKIHQGYKATNKSIAKLAKVLMPHVAIIDAYEGMEGEGPIDGEPVEMKVALAGTDALAVDSVAAYLAGFDARQIGYLYYCEQQKLGIADFGKINIVGNARPEECRRKFRPHSTYAQQINWK